MRIGNPKYKEIDQQLVVYFDTRADDSLPISHKLLRRQSKRIADSLGIVSFKGSKDTFIGS